jgi:fructose-bisphosphate aldolase class II
MLTLDGGSGTNDDDFRKAIAAGINIVHINTELRVAWRRGLENGLVNSPMKSFLTRSCRTQSKQ